MVLLLMWAMTVLPWCAVIVVDIVVAAVVMLCSGCCCVNDARLLLLILLLCDCLSVSVLIVNWIVGANVNCVVVIVAVADDERCNADGDNVVVIVVSDMTVVVAVDGVAVGVIDDDVAVVVG